MQQYHDIFGIQISRSTVTSVPPSSPTRPAASSIDNSSTMIGFEEHLRKLKRRILTDVPNLQISLLFGIGGIGKTTLAHNVYHDKLIRESFRFRLWSTVSQSYNV